MLFQLAADDASRILIGVWPRPCNIRRVMEKFSRQRDGACKRSRKAYDVFAQSERMGAAKPL